MLRTLGTQAKHSKMLSVKFSPSMSKFFDYCLLPFVNNIRILTFKMKILQIKFPNAFPVTYIVCPWLVNQIPLSKLSTLRNFLGRIENGDSEVAFNTSITKNALSDQTINFSHNLRALHKNKLLLLDENHHHNTFYHWS